MRIHHVGIVVDDLEEAKRFVGSVLGLELQRELDVPQLKRRVAFYRCGEVEIELIDDLDLAARQSSLAGATARIEHVALEVDDMEASLQRLAVSGVRIDARGILSVGSRLNAWTQPGTTDGVMYQLVTEPSKTEGRPWSGTTG
jgi:methylmalonyl-CoA/ethylmalonyl-CoA epimerase